jgi:hypothetical protein
MTGFEPGSLAGLVAALHEAMPGVRLSLMAEYGPHHKAGVKLSFLGILTAVFVSVVHALGLRQLPHGCSGGRSPKQLDSHWQYHFVGLLVQVW